VIAAGIPPSLLWRLRQIRWAACAAGKAPAGPVGRGSLPFTAADGCHMPERAREPFCDALMRRMVDRPGRWHMLLMGFPPGLPTRTAVLRGHPPRPADGRRGARARGPARPLIKCLWRGTLVGSHKTQRAHNTTGAKRGMVGCSHDTDPRRSTAEISQHGWQGLRFYPFRTYRLSPPGLNFCRWT